MRLEFYEEILHRCIAFKYIAGICSVIDESGMHYCIFEAVTGRPIVVQVVDSWALYMPSTIGNRKTSIFRGVDSSVAF